MSHTCPSLPPSLHQVDLAENMHMNSELAASYRQFQSEFIRIKTQALRVIERKLELETSLRDHKQVPWYTDMLQMS